MLNSDLEMPRKGHFHLQQVGRYQQMEVLQQGQPTRSLCLPKVPYEPSADGRSKVRYANIRSLHFLQSINGLPVQSGVCQVRPRSLWQHRHRQLMYVALTQTNTSPTWQSTWTLPTMWSGLVGNGFCSNSKNICCPSWASLRPICPSTTSNGASLNRWRQCRNSLLTLRVHSNCTDSILFSIQRGKHGCSKSMAVLRWPPTQRKTKSSKWVSLTTLWRSSTWKECTSFFTQTQRRRITDRRIRFDIQKSGNR
jgi:hypothetical protein